MLAARRAWYDLMIADEVRNSAYRRALAMYAPGRTVVDVGAGLGHLSLWALEAGARKVVLIDEDQDALDEAVDTLASYRNEEGRCEFLPAGPSYDYVLEEVCIGDVVVAEIFDSSGVGEGAIATLQDARRFLRPGGIMIPSSMRVHVCLLYGYDTTWPERTRERRLASTTVPDADAVWFDWSPGEVTGIHVQHSGDVYGFGLAFTLSLAPGVLLSNLPSDPPTHWKQGALPFAGPIKARKGDVWIVRGDVDYSRDRLNPDVSFNVLRIES